MADDQQHAGNLKLLGGRLCLDFANTLSWRTSDNPQERLRSYNDLVSWGQHVGFVSKHTAHQLFEEAAYHPADALVVLERAIVLRESIFGILSSIAERRTPEHTDIATFNSVLSESMSRLQLVLTAEGFSWSWIGDGISLEQIIWPIAWSAAELLTSGELKRLGICAGEGCGWLFLDTSKNHSRRWCAMEDCGNRAKVRRYYRRSRNQNKKDK